MPSLLLLVTMVSSHAATAVIDETKRELATPPFVPWVFAPHFTIAMGHPVSGTQQVAQYLPVLKN